MMTRITDLPERVPRHLLPGRGETVVCAVSGGLDSMCLLDLLVRWCGQRQGHVVAAHFNHRLRPAADRDEAFVRDWCAENGVSFVSGSGGVRTLAGAEGLSVEEAARKLRYAFLRQTAADRGASRIYTAHHADDNAETVLMNLIRGTGLTGLTGMSPSRDGVVRPLLDVTRAELAEYASAHGVPHVEDETNADPDAAARNFLRLRVMPLLKELNPRAAEHMNNTARQLRAVDRSLEEEARRRTAHVEAREGRVILPVRELRDAPDDIRARMLLRLFDLLGVGRKDVGSTHIQALLLMARRAGHGEGSRVSLPHGVTARCGHGRLILETRPQSLTEARLMPGQTLRWGDYTLALLDRQEGEGLALRERTELEDIALTVGPCAPGGRLTLPGANGGRSVKRLCLDKHISLTERDRLPAIYANGRLAAVWRLGVDTEFLPEGKPCRFIQIQKETEENDHEK